MTKRKRVILIVFCFALALSMIASISAQDMDMGTISATGIWARPATEGETSAAYMLLTNSTDTDITLVAGTTDVAGVVEIHETRMNNDVMQMRPLDDGLTIPAGETVELRPGSFHVMFMDIPAPLEIGDAFTPDSHVETEMGMEEVVLGVPVLEFPPESGDLVITQAWARSTASADMMMDMNDDMDMMATEEAMMDMDMSGTSAAYMFIENTGDEDITLISGATDAAGIVEIHESSMTDQGVMQMRPLADGLTIPAGETVELRPGGFHVMFMDLQQPFVEDEALYLELTFDNGETLALGVPIGDPMLRMMDTNATSIAIKRVRE